MDTPIIDLPNNRSQAFINYVAPEKDASSSIQKTVISLMSHQTNCIVESVQVSTYAVPNLEGHPWVGMMISVIFYPAP